MTDDTKKRGKQASAVVNQMNMFGQEQAAPEESLPLNEQGRTWTTRPDHLMFDRQPRPVRHYAGVREMRPDGRYAYLVCPNGALHCILIEPGDAVIIVRNNGDFVDMVVKSATDKAAALRAAAAKFLRLIEWEGKKK